MEEKEKDIVEYVESEVLYLKIENASSFKKRIEKIENTIDYINKGIKNLKNAIALKITHLKLSYKREIPKLENSIIDFEKNLPLTKEQFMEYIREKIKRERIKALEKLKEQLEKKKKEKIEING